MFKIVNLHPNLIDEIVRLILEARPQTLSILQLLFFHPIAKPPERPLASTAAKDQLESNVSNAFITVTLSPSVS